MFLSNINSSDTLKGEDMMNLSDIFSKTRLIESLLITKNSFKCDEFQITE